MNTTVDDDALSTTAVVCRPSDSRPAAARSTAEVSGELSIVADKSACEYDDCYDRLRLNAAQSRKIDREMQTNVRSATNHSQRKSVERFDCSVRRSLCVQSRARGHMRRLANDAGTKVSYDARRVFAARRYASARHPPVSPSVTNPSAFCQNG